MRAKELMIGDWVQSSFHKEPVRISSIKTSDGYGWVLNDADEWHYKDLQYKSDASLSPIPLTEDMLIANGFIYDSEDGWEYCGKNYEPLIGYYPKDKFFSIDYNGCSSEHKIAYVHEYQHVLRLCGLNDMADNFKIE